MSQKNKSYKRVKRVKDILLSSVLIIVLMPIFIFIALLTLIILGYPVLFCQRRVGMNNRVFTIYKFRTMYPQGNNNAPDKDRMNWYGRLLRALHLDEIPQLFNILVGDMSFIGPRPLLPEYLPYYSNFEIQRHQVRPGLSGLSQVNSIYPSWEKQFSLDIEYIERLSFKLDLVIFLKTIITVLNPPKELLTGELSRPRFDVYRKKSDN